MFSRPLVYTDGDLEFWGCHACLHPARMQGPGSSSKDSPKSKENEKALAAADAALNKLELTTRDSRWRTQAEDKA